MKRDLPVARGRSSALTSAVTSQAPRRWSKQWRRLRVLSLSRPLYLFRPVTAPKQFITSCLDRCIILPADRPFGQAHHGESERLFIRLQVNGSPSRRPHAKPISCLYEMTRSMMHLMSKPPRALSLSRCARPPRLLRVSTWGCSCSGCAAADGGECCACLSARPEHAGALRLVILAGPVWAGG